MTIIRKGDIVTVRAKVVADADEDGVYVDIGYHQYGSRVDLGRVEVVEPHFGVGEMVVIGGGTTGTVIGATDGHVWVRHTIGHTFGTYPARDLRLAVDRYGPVSVDTSLIETPPSATYIVSADKLGGSLADSAPKLPHLADAVADV